MYILYMYNVPLFSSGDMTKGKTDMKTLDMTVDI